MSHPNSLLRFIRRIARRSDDDATDCQLLERFASGRDETAFAALVARHGPMVLGVCRRVLHNAHDAEDAFQAAFLVLARKAGSISRPEALGNWLYGVAYRTALEARTKDAKRRARERERAEKATVDPSSAIVWSDIRAVLDSEVNRLPDKYRSPFVLCYMEGRTNEEAARLLRCPKGTILSRLAWARQRLRDRLARRGVTLSAVGASAVLTADSLSAAVSAELVNSTASAARLFVGGQATASVEVLSLAKGVLQAMFIDKVKIASVVLVVVALVGGGLAWLGQPTWASGPKEVVKPAAPVKAEELLDTLFTLEKSGWEATKKKDVAGLRKMCAEDFVAIHSDGSRATRDAFFLLAFPFFELKSYSLSDVRLLSLGPDAAILVYKAESEMVVLGETLKEQTQHSSTWVRRNGEWRNVFYQETLIEQ
jgi:RNA polymerase sigma factor (sigma-70 family)